MHVYKKKQTEKAEDRKKNNTHGTCKNILIYFQPRTRKSQSTRRALAGAYVPPTKVFRQLTGSVNKTIVKPGVAAAANTYTSDFPDVKFRVPALIR